MKNYTLVFSIILILLGACKPQEKEKITENQNREHKRLPVVSTLKISPDLFRHFFEVQGRVKAEKDVFVTPEAGGRITSLPVKEGQIIRRGQMVARFDNSTVSASLEELHTRLENAKYMYEKQKRLYEKGVGTEVAFKAAETQYNALLKSINRINSQRRKFSLFAPFTGYVEKVFPVVGQVAGPQSPIIHLIDMSRLSAKAGISEIYLKQIGMDTKVNLFFPALDLRMEDLKIKRIGRVVNPKDRTIDIEVAIPNPPTNLIPNLMAVIEVNDYNKEQAIAIPTRAILKDYKDNYYVYALSKDGRASKTLIERGRQYKNITEVLSGLHPGDEIILRGARAIADGDQVKVRNSNDK